MSERRQARTRLTAADLDELPVELRAGACLEVWAPGDAWGARRRWGAAKDAWLAARGIHPQWDIARVPDGLQRGRRVWSFDYLKADDPERLEARLGFLRLPLDWTPVVVGIYDYGPSLLPENMTSQQYEDWRERQEQHA